MTTLSFTGNALHAFGEIIPAQCIVRNRNNKWRRLDEVVRTSGSTTPHGLPYDPRPFPPGLWMVTAVIFRPENKALGPVYIATNAHQDLPVWTVNGNEYMHPTDRQFTARGYGCHFARYEKNGEWVPSRTSLGCIVVPDEEAIMWLGTGVHDLMSAQEHVAFDVPEWDTWEAA